MLADLHVARQGEANPKSQIPNPKSQVPSPKSQISTINTGDEVVAEARVARAESFATGSRKFPLLAGGLTAISRWRRLLARSPSAGGARLLLDLRPGVRARPCDSHQAPGVLTSDAMISESAFGLGVDIAVLAATTVLLVMIAARVYPRVVR